MGKTQVNPFPSHSPSLRMGQNNYFRGGFRGKGTRRRSVALSEIRPTYPQKGPPLVLCFLTSSFVCQTFYHFSKGAFGANICAKKKRFFLGHNFSKKMPKHSIFDRFFQKFSCGGKNFVEKRLRVFIEFWERSENQFGQSKKKNPKVF